MKSIIAVVILMITVGIAGCSTSNNNTKPSESASSVPSQSATPPVKTQNVRFELDQSNFSLKQWRVDGSHITSLKGRLLLDEQPVKGSELHAGSSKKKIQTGEDGSFELTVDQSLLADTQVQVISLDKATVAGKPIDKEASSKLLDASTHIGVYYPIQISKVEASLQDGSQVQVHGQIIAEKGDTVSFFQVDKYRIGGVVKDAEGNPVQNAVVWFDRDEGEGFGKSTPTDELGRYSIFYLPEEDETNLTVSLGKKRYTLPEGKVFLMPEDTSVEINIVLPKEGTIIEDQPPNLISKTSSGAMYTGVLVGLDVPKDVNYTITVPDQEGRFLLAVSQAVWEQYPSFFETKLSKFVEEGTLTWGDTLPPGFFQPRVNDPKDIQTIFL